MTTPYPLFTVTLVGLMLNFARSEKLVYVEARRTWIDALNVCSAHNGSLASPGDILDLIMSCSNNFGDVWSSDHTVISRWLAAIGCVRDDTLMVDAVALDIDLTNDPFDAAKCEEFCSAISNTSLFGISNKTCGCVTSAAVPSINQQTDCDGFWAGGNNLSTLYRAYSIVVPRDTDRSQRLCLSQNCGDDGSLLAEECLRTLPMRCEREVIRRPQAWISGAQECWNTTGEFPYPYTDPRCVDDLSEHRWIGLFRNVISRTKPRFADGDENLLETCVLVNSVEAKTDECSQPRSSMCKVPNDVELDQGIVDTELVCNPDRDGGAITTAPSTTPVPTTVRTTTTGIAFTTTTEAVTESTEGFTTTDVQTLEPVIEPRFLITYVHNKIEFVLNGLVEHPTTDNEQVNVATNTDVIKWKVDKQEEFVRSIEYDDDLLIAGCVPLLVSICVCIAIAYRRRRKMKILPVLPSHDDLGTRWENQQEVELSTASPYNLYDDLKDYPNVRHPSAQALDHEDLPRDQAITESDYENTPAVLGRQLTSDYETLCLYEDPAAAYSQLDYMKNDTR